MERARKWIELLNISEIRPFQLTTELNYVDLRVIQQDVRRTRIPLLNEHDRRRLETMIIYYCKDRQVTYKQGMHEIFAGFYLMTKEGVPEYMAYTLCAGFIEVLFGSMFEGRDFRPLHGLFEVFRLLLQYHRPLLANFLSEHDINPELITTSWLLTGFAYIVPSIPVLLDL